jgi:hypothetical protein
MGKRLWVYLVVAGVGLSVYANPGCMRRCGSHACEVSKLVELAVVSEAATAARGAATAQMSGQFDAGLTKLGRM